MKNYVGSKKIISIAIIIFLLLFTTKIYAVSDRYTTTLKASSAKVKREANLTITIGLKDIAIESGEKGIGAYTAIIKYDSSILEYVSTNGTNKWESPFYQNGLVTGITKDGEVVKTAQDIGTITFKVKKDAKLGETTIQLTNFYGSTVETDVFTNNRSIKVTIIDNNTGNNSGDNNTGNNNGNNNTGNNNGNNNTGNNNGNNNTGNNNGNNNTGNNNGNNNTGNNNGNNNTGNNNGNNNTGNNSGNNNTGNNSGNNNTGNNNGNNNTGNNSGNNNTGNNNGNNYTGNNSSNNNAGNNSDKNNIVNNNVSNSSENNSDNQNNENNYISDTNNTNENDDINEDITNTLEEINTSAKQYQESSETRTINIVVFVVIGVCVAILTICCLFIKMKLFNKKQNNGK